MTLYDRELSFNSFTLLRSSSLAMGLPFFLILSHKLWRFGPRKGFLNSVLLFCFRTLTCSFLERIHYLFIFCASTASFILRRASSLEMGFAIACRDFQTRSRSSFIFAFRNGFKSFSSKLIEQIYRYKTTLRNSIVRFRLHRKPSPVGFSFSSFQFLKPQVESSFLNCNRRLLSKNLVKDNPPLGSVYAADFRILILPPMEWCYRDSHLPPRLNLKNLNPYSLKFIFIAKTSQDIPAGRIS